MIEAEIKALLADPVGVAAALDRRAPAEPAEYADSYYDTADRALRRGDRELRLRTVSSAAGRRHLLTYKQAAVAGTDSKPEHETAVAEPAALDVLFADLGLRCWLDYTKHCVNHRLDHAGYPVLATLVRLPELTGCWLEVETLVAGEAELPAALAALGDLLGRLGVGPAELDRRSYTGLVEAARAGRA